MTDPLRATVEVLYRCKLSDFVAERKRLADELKGAGKKELAARVAKLGRPSVSAWAVNQLWWQERELFTLLLAAAARVKKGERDASREHRELLGQLRERAATLLQDAGNAASDTTLRRVATTLSALAASGGFEPDPPGALAADRDPPGFEALEGMLALAPSAKPALAPSAKPARSESDDKRAEQERRRAEEQARQQRAAERERLSAALREAQHLREVQQRKLSELRRELDAAEQSLKNTQALLSELEAKLASL
jgi:hypothetical protein